MRKVDLDAVVAASRQGFRLERVRAEETHDWSDTDGTLRHRSGGFFSCVGVRDNRGDERLLMYQPQAAITGILRNSASGAQSYLVQARAEPGCLNAVQFGPTVQSTPANFLRAHGGAATPFIDSFLVGRLSDTVIQDSSQTDLGERYLEKTKRSIVLETNGEIDVAQDNFVWADVPALRDGLKRDAYFNIDLRSLLAVTDWADRPSDDMLGPVSEKVCASLRQPLRSAALGPLHALLAERLHGHRTFVALQELDNWQRTAFGWNEIEARQGFAVDFYSVNTRYREVNAWVQPLINSNGSGQAFLACRDLDGVLEVYVRAIRESGRQVPVLAPTYLCYPGAVDSPPEWVTEKSYSEWIGTTESDEGGRFFQDATDYRLVWADATAELGDDGQWITVAELKSLLRLSNIASIQLRCLASLLLVAETP